MVSIADCLDQFNNGMLNEGCNNDDMVRLEENEISTNATFNLASVPNPFTNTTSISYQLPYETDVTIDVYNYLGQHVTTLVSETQEEGNHTVNFDARLLPNGVYNCRIQAGDYSQTIKLVLMK